MSEPFDGDMLADRVDKVADEAAWQAWLRAHPEAATEVAIAGRVQQLLAQMNELAIVAPDGFEARLMARIRDDRGLLDLLELSFDGCRHVLIELLNALFALLPAAPPATAS